MKKRSLPVVLLNARITKKTFFRWNFILKTVKRIFNSFELCLSSSHASKNYLEKLNVKNNKYYGNLKFTIESDPNSKNSQNQKILKKNKFWSAISTHKGEEIFCLKTHLKIKEFNPNIKTIIIPRHINRVERIKKDCKSLIKNSNNF